MVSNSSLPTDLGSSKSNAIDTIQAEYDTQKLLFDAQPPMVQRFLEAQASRLADAVKREQSQISFTLPDHVVLDPFLPGKTNPVPKEYREQSIGGVMNRLLRSDVRTTMRLRMIELEGSTQSAVAVSARLLRHATANYMIYSMLPSGRSVIYEAAEGEEIPTIPLQDSANLESAITQSSDAIVEESAADEKRGELQVPFVPYARSFYLPQWVILDENGRLLVNSVPEGEARLASMQSFLSILHMAVSVAPYMITDPVYQQKRYGMLGQLVNQGRALAYYQTEEMVRLIKKRAASQDLNRGLSLSMPYFDDQALEMHIRDFEVIPSGRIMFVPAFVVRAACEQQAKVAQDTRLSPSTRKYLILELKLLENAFDSRIKGTAQEY